MVAQGAAFWLLQLARELDDAILDIRAQRARGRHHRVQVGRRSAARARARQVPRRADDHWLAARDRAEMEARAQARRHDVALARHAGRARLVLRRHARRAGLRGRPLLHADRQPGGRQPAARRDHPRRCELLRRARDEQRPVAARDALPRRARSRLRRPRTRERQAARRRGGRRARPRHLRARRHRLGRRGAAVPRGARELLARRPHRHGGEPALRRPRDDGNEDLRAADRVAELDLPAPERGRARGRADAIRLAGRSRISI